LLPETNLKVFIAPKGNGHKKHIIEKLMKLNLKVMNIF